jgi:hypothetical protein
VFELEFCQKKIEGFSVPNSSFVKVLTGDNNMAMITLGFLDTVSIKERRHIKSPAL